MIKHKTFFTKAQIILLSLDSQKIIKEIQQETELPPTTIQRALKTLENLNLIRSSKNKRKRLIELTKKGKKTRDLLVQIQRITSAEHT